MSNIFKQIKHVPYNDREERNKFIVSQFGKYLGTKVLNVGGGGQQYLQKFLSEEIVSFELDIVGNPDLKVNLERELPIPIDDNAFETVICTDVLEHLDNLHDVWLELIRISSRYVIISLPNPLCGSLMYVMEKPYKNNSLNNRKTFGKFMKFYGLPYEKPVDRHKWFYAITEAEEFIEYQADKFDLRIREMFTVGYDSNSLRGKLLRALIRVLLGNEARKNLFCQALWCVLEKPHGKG